MKLQAKAWKFGDNTSTDLIAPGRYFHLRANLPELAKHVLEDADADFAKKVRKGDIIVAGKNFGLGSSREHAAQIIKLAGVSAVLAKSFARIFYRNAINIGLPALEVDTDKIYAGDEVEVEPASGAVFNKTRNIGLQARPLPEFMLQLLKDGGLVEHIKKHGDFRLR
ncbi:MAG: 3-isopropylmalate dehydratase small subunit [Candidatus Hydrothermarchaeota archaeon]|nr:3-isopropylmalate dehydratase small subunit [Candidatus Hydrothermarchaeota archaeon]